MKREAKRCTECGFTLLELVIAIVLLGILTTLAVFSFDGSKSRGQLLVAGMDEYGNALSRMKADTACYPTTLKGLFDRNAVTGAQNSTCGVDLGPQWNGPYARDARADDGGNILLDQIAPGISLAIRSAAGGAGTLWYLDAKNVPGEILTQALIACNGAAGASGRCVESGGSSGTQTAATLSLKFAETR